MAQPVHAEPPPAALASLVATAWPGAAVTGRATLQVRLQEGVGRGVERLHLTGRQAPTSCILKWRNDRPDDREGLLYARVLDGALLAPALHARASVEGVLLLLLEDVPGRPLDPHDVVARDVALHALGRAHAASHRRILQARAGNVAALVRPGGEPAARVLAELHLADANARGMPVAADPDVFDQGDLRPENVLVDPGAGRTWIVDYENAAVRPRSAALAPLLHGAHGWPPGPAAQRAWQAYLAGWSA